MLTMQNAWERQLHNGRYSNGDSSDYVSQRQQQQQQQQRQIGPDRSISAPPPSSFNLSYNNNVSYLSFYILFMCMLCIFNNVVCILCVVTGRFYIIQHPST